MKNLVFVLFVFFPCILIGQWHEMKCITLSVKNQNHHVVSDRYDFSFYPPDISLRNNPEIFNDNSANSFTFSDSVGNELFYTNGDYIFDLTENKILANGTDLMPGGNNGFIIAPNTYIVLPNNRVNASYLLFYYTNFSPGRIDEKKDLRVLRVDSMGLNKNARIAYRDKPITIQKNLQYLCATKHANGSDWWMITAEGSDSTFSNIKHLVYLITGDSVELKHEIPFGEWTFGNNVFFAEPKFSPDGKFLCYSDRHDGFFVWDFDRCTGLLSNFRYDEYQQSLQVYFGSVSIASNSRYAYVHSNDFILQYDLLSHDLSSSKDTVVKYDGYHVKTYLGHITDTRINTLNLTPNGKIIGQTNGWQHQIIYPNKKGGNCMPLLHSFPTIVGYGTNTNYPHYRLGPIDGSSCDTLGLDNHPLADFRWDYTQAVTGDPLWVQFTDNSFYEPATWAWDFGDGSVGSTDTCPAHTFPAPGVYEVCMTVCNMNSCDTVCKDVLVGEVFDDLVADYNELIYDHIVHDTFRVEFFGENYRYPVTYSWDFGDGTTGTGQIQDHSYDLPGFYEVCLVVCNNFMCDTLCKMIQVGGSSAIMQAKYSVLSSDSLTVAFRDMSIVNPTAWTWDFGDGTTSIEQNPTHTFPSAGVYSVCLTACNAFGLCDTICKDISVDAANISFTAHFGFTISDTTGLVHFVDQSLSNPISWVWDFGDGTTSTEQSPSHQYTAAGSYDVCLVACNNILCDTFCSPTQVVIVSSSTEEQGVAFQNFTLHPNPIQDILNIQTQETIHETYWFMLHDVVGRVVIERVLTSNQKTWQIDLSNLAAAPYFYTIKNEVGRVLQVGRLLRE